MLRDGALSDARVIEAANGQFVPVWVNIRREPFPVASALQSGYEWDLLLDHKRRVRNLYYYGFYIRTFVLTPDLRRVLNGSLWDQVVMSDANAYLSVLRRATSACSSGSSRTTSLSALPASRRSPALPAP